MTHHLEGGVISLNSCLGYQEVHILKGDTAAALDLAGIRTELVT